MAGENAARLVRDRATLLARRAAQSANLQGATEAAHNLNNLADEIAKIGIPGETQNG